MSLLFLALFAAAPLQSADDYVRSAGEKCDKGDYEGAIADYSKSIELDPKRALAYLNRGAAKKHKGDTGRKQMDECVSAAAELKALGK